ncbi:hypothetical protein Tco_0669329 [Tanacetum coccineum]
MARFEQLETHLHDLYLNSSSHAVDAFKPAFHSFFGEEHQTFKLKMFYNLDQYGYIKNHKKTVKNGQTRTRESEEYKRSQGFKAKAKKTYGRGASLRRASKDFTGLSLDKPELLISSSEPLSFCLAEASITAPSHISSGPGPQLLTPRTISSGLVRQPPSPTPNILPTKNDSDSLSCPMMDEYFNPSPSVVQHVLVAVVQEPVVSTGTPSSTRIDQDTPSTSTSQTTQEEQSHVIRTSVEEDDHGIEVAHMDNDL